MPGLLIFYCSRTHSQLTQFINELRRVKFPPSFPQGEESALEEEIKHLSLASRKNLCINPKVTKLGNPTAINERCLELQRSGRFNSSQTARNQNIPLTLLPERHFAGVTVSISSQEKSPDSRSGFSRPHTCQDSRYRRPGQLRKENGCLSILRFKVYNQTKRGTSVTHGFLHGCISDGRFFSS